MKIYLTLLFTIIISFAKAQKITLNFKIDSIENGSMIYLKPYLNKDYYSTIIVDSTIVKDNKITFLINEFSFTSPFVLETDIINGSFYSSRPFYLKNKSLDIKLSKLYEEIDNDINERSKYKKYFKNINKEIVDYENFLGQNFIKYQFNNPKEVNDSIDNWSRRNWKNEIDLLEQYIKENPNSEISLWKIIEKFERFYKDYPYEKLYSNFDRDIKQSYPFKVLEQKIKENKKFGLGKKFPTIDNLIALDGKKYRSDYAKNKYTLIDFWFSSCKPCLITFPKLKEIYSQYHDKGFEIEAISVDRDKYIKNWKNTIIKYNLPWINVLDDEKKFSETNEINSFPTNFLINEKGEIIMKNIDSKQLEIFLKEQLQ